MPLHRRCSHAAASQQLLGAISRDDNVFYCKACWRGFSLALRLPCHRCGQQQWGTALSTRRVEEHFSCSSCSSARRTDSVPQRDAAPSPDVVRTGEVSDNCQQCGSSAFSGYLSVSEKDAPFYCAPCWAKFPGKATRSACHLCHRQLPGKVRSVDLHRQLTSTEGTHTRAETPCRTNRFLCDSCSSVLQQKLDADAVLQQQQRDDEALLEEVVDMKALATRPGCKFLDACLFRILGILQVDAGETAMCSKAVNDVNAILAPMGLCALLYGSRRTGTSVTSRSDIDLFVTKLPDCTEGTTTRAEKKHGTDGAQFTAAAVYAAKVSKRLSAVAAALTDARADNIGKNKTCLALDNSTALKEQDGNHDRETSTTAVMRDVTIVNAKVPLVRCVHRESSQMMDLSFTPVGVLGSDYLVTHMHSEPAARPLAVLLKAVLTSWQMLDPTTGTLGSFPLVLMVIWFLKHSDHASVEFFRSSISLLKESGMKASTTSLPLTLLLVGFMEYFGSHFDSKHFGIDLLEGKLVQRSRYGKSPGGICVRHPVDRSGDAANGCTKFQTVIRPQLCELAKRLDHLARMKFVMTTSSVYRLVDELLFRPLSSFVGKDVVSPAVATRLASMANSGHAEEIHLTPQHRWDATSNVYTGGLGIPDICRPQGE